MRGLRTALAVACVGCTSTPAMMGPADMAVEVERDMAQRCTVEKGCVPVQLVCDVESGQCVECLDDSLCPSGKVCKQHKCQPGCTQSHGCPDGGGACDTQSGQCRICGGDGDCGGDKPRCDLTTGLCVPCLPLNDNCPVGFVCTKVNASYLCAMGCKADGDCPADGGAGKMLCCDHVCLDVSGDNANCGKCGVACGGKTCCNSACVDTATDANNCGTCGLACNLPHASSNCKNAKCSVDMCTPGAYADCDGVAANGCETVLATDPMNCTGCGKACVGANAVMGCNSGCFIQMCMQGFADCDVNVLDGCEVNVAGDPNNCGACNKKCGLPNANPACVAGACAVGTCKVGFADCDGTAMNGCEVATSNDAKNCGSCFLACTVPNGTGACANGMCQVVGCNPPFKNCSGMFGDGCNVDTSSDANNCGNCGMKCPNPANANAGCTNSACSIGSCKTGFADCDKMYFNGCEVNVNTDVNNCGVCGNKCGVLACCGAACVNTLTDPANCGGCGKACAPANATGACNAGQCAIASCNAGFADCDGNAANGCEVNLNADANNCKTCGGKCAQGLYCVNAACATLPTCNAIHQNNPALPSGTYSVKPFNLQFNVLCDMTTFGGGWTLVAREQPMHISNLIFLDGDTNNTDNLAMGGTDGIIGKRFSNNYKELWFQWGFDYARFGINGDIFANALQTAVPLTNFNTSDSTLANWVANAGGAIFCNNTRDGDVRPGDTSWAIKPKDDMNVGCGCSSGGWVGKGAFYGGSPNPTFCGANPGGFAGVKDTGQPKAVKPNWETQIWVR